ncbi:MULTISPECIES: hybrid sensor histidine kinase/response regulator [Stenotrophomonas]|jgi:signal transduction histidine kinase|uniref:hybrid sensor histidine kinase/response regulator n=1 Tax=Stenotrophomonas TaxID=40323 RepID=UPI000703B064|nr:MULTISPECIES: response regulator [Stenotrophomonas]KRG85275.1 histidine kinase [Stenotrophomonas acidaminiphila]QOF99132.1 response regulator [Stenotrophomonas sp. CW117]
MPNKGTPLGPLRILLVEDSAEDAELLCDQMLEAGLECSFERVDSDAEMRALLARWVPDIVLSDLSMPGFSGYQALRILRETHPQVPFIFVSGTMGEETAVQALHEGANDYIIKHQPARLPSAVARAVREARREMERLRVEDELMRAQRLESLALLAAGLSHDLRNILQPLLIVPDLIRDRSDDPKVVRLADVIAECGRRGHEMVESMLSFVRGSRLPSERIVLQRLFQAVGMLLKSSLPGNIDLHLDVRDERMAVEGNYTELQQVLLNLALNAIQAMPDGGRLSLVAERVATTDGERLCIRVQDQGIGMDETTLERLFSPFFTTKASGTGLGLVSCKRIVESLDGTISVSSRLGEGTCFNLLLPLHGAVAEPEVGDRPVVPAGRGQRILVVDDEATRLSLLGNALASQGYRLRLAADGAAAMRHLQEAGMPDAVLVDSGIPLLSAGQLLTEMHGMGYRGPAIVLEENSNEAFADGMVPAGISVHVLPRPLEMQRVFRVVADALGTG